MLILTGGYIMKKELISGMFSSIPEAKLFTEMMGIDDAEILENSQQPTESNTLSPTQSTDKTSENNQDAPEVR